MNTLVTPAHLIKVPVAELDPAIHAFLRPHLGAVETWMPGTSPGKG
jgi:hypothetical protein